MFFIWSSEGAGPLRYIGPILLLTQLYWPQLLNGDFSAIQNIQAHDIMVFAITMVLFSITMFVLFRTGWLPMPPTDAGNEPAAAAASPGGAIPTNAAERPPPRSPFVALFYNPRILPDAIRSFVQSLSPLQLIYFSVLIFPVLILMPVLLAMADAHIMFELSPAAVTILALSWHLCMAYAAYAVVRDFIAGNAPGPYPGAEAASRRRRLTVNEISEVLRKVPVEEYVSEESLASAGGAECSVSRLKRMLVSRGEGEAVDKCLERRDLVEALGRCRKWNEECIICAEDYVEGDALRIVPCCQNEFHLSCFDKWIYTFASSAARGGTRPTCPMCKAELQQ